MNKNTDSTQTPNPSIKNRLSDVPTGTFIGSMDDGSLSVPAAQKCSVIHLVLPNFPSTTYEALEFIEKNITIIITGDGDYRLNSDFCNLLRSLKEAGIKVETLILNNLEIDSETLKEILESLKSELNSMQFNKVPLDQPHIKILNGIQMNLHSVSFEYSLPDYKNIFEEIEGENNTTISLKLVNLGSQLRYLDLKGIQITPEIQKGIEQLDNLQHLNLENLVGDQALEFLKNLLANLNRYSKLTTLSLAGNDLSSIDFSDLLEDSDYDLIFPSTLKKLNLNSTHLSDKHIQDILKLLQISKIKLDGLHLRKCHAYQRTFRALKKFINPTENSDLQYEAPVTSLEPQRKGQNNKNILEEAPEGKELEENDSKENHLEGSNPKENDPEGNDNEENNHHPKFDMTVDQLWRNLLEFAREISTFIEESRAKTNPQGLEKICKLNTANQFLPIILKDAVGIKAFLNACKHNKIDFTRDPQSLIPKNDFNLALKDPKADLDKTLDYADEQSLGEYKIPLINQVHPKRISDDIFAKEPMEIQRENFLDIMEEMGFESKEVEISDGVEDVFKVLVDDSQYIGWDYKLATFSIIWRPQYSTVSVKFNLSDDWFMDRKDRTNVYALRNQDYLIDLLSTLNEKPLDYVGELDVLRDGETELNIRYTIMKYGPLNLAKLLLVAIDKGFVFLKTLQEKNIFDHEDSSSVGEDAKQIRKAVKTQLKAFAKSKEFIALSRADNN